MFVGQHVFAGDEIPPALKMPDYSNCGNFEFHSVCGEAALWKVRQYQGDEKYVEKKQECYQLESECKAMELGTGISEHGPPGGLGIIPAVIDGTQKILENSSDKDELRRQNEYCKEKKSAHLKGVPYEVIPGECRYLRVDPQIMFQPDGSSELSDKLGETVNEFLDDKTNDQVETPVKNILIEEGKITIHKTEDVERKFKKQLNFKQNLKNSSKDNIYKNNNRFDCNEHIAKRGWQSVCSYIHDKPGFARTFNACCSRQ